MPNTFPSVDDVAEEEAYCCYFCIPMKSGMKFLQAFNVVLSIFFLSYQIPYLFLDPSFKQNGFIPQEGPPSTLLLCILGGSQVFTILLILSWFANMDYRSKRQNLVAAQVVYVLSNLLLTVYMDRSGLGAAIYDAFFIYPCMKYASFAKV